MRQWRRRELRHINLSAATVGGKRSWKPCLQLHLQPLFTHTGWWRMMRGERLSFGNDERSALSWRIIGGERLSFANHLFEGAESRQQ